MDRILITAVPFGEIDPAPLEWFKRMGVEYTLNPFHRKLREEELMELIPGYTILIAGTEPITARVIEKAANLRLIARVGIGLDSVDLDAARTRGIQVTYTPDAPSAAVADLTLGLMFSLLRSIPNADRDIRRGTWHRYTGRRLAECTVGTIGAGRVGKQVAEALRALGANVLANDLNPDERWAEANKVIWTDKESLYRNSDIVTLHAPLTPLTRNLITREQIGLMKPDAFIINTARGEIINEEDLFSGLISNRIAGAALDVFEAEPYSGPLSTLENCLLTCHMASMTRDCRARMEFEAAEDAACFLEGKPLKRLVPELLG